MANSSFIFLVNNDILIKDSSFAYLQKSTKYFNIKKLNGDIVSLLKQIILLFNFMARIARHSFATYTLANGV